MDSLRGFIVGLRMYPIHEKNLARNRIDSTIFHLMNVSTERKFEAVCKTGKEKISRKTCVCVRMMRRNLIVISRTE